MSVYKGHKNSCFVVFFNFWICLNPLLYSQYYYGTVGSKKKIYIYIWTSICVHQHVPGTSSNTFNYVVNWVLTAKGRNWSTWGFCQTLRAGYLLCLALWQAIQETKQQAEQWGDKASQTAYAKGTWYMHAVVPCMRSKKVNGGRPLFQHNVQCNSLSGTLCFNYTLARQNQSMEEVVCNV